MGMIIGSRFRNALCVQFNGVDESLTLTNPSFGNDSLGTAALWWRPDSLLTANGSRAIWSFVDPGTGEFFAVRQFRGTTTANQNRIQILNTSSPIGNWHGNTALAASTWYSIVLTSDSSSWSLYVNGSLQSLTNISGSNSGNWLADIPGGSNRVMRFAAQGSATPAQFCPCRIDEITIWGNAWSAGDVAEWHNAGVPRNPHRLSFASSLREWWRCGDSRDTGATIYGEYANNDLSTVNMDGSNYVSV